MTRRSRPLCGPSRRSDLALDEVSDLIGREEPGATNAHRPEVLKANPSVDRAWAAVEASIGISGGESHARFG